MFSGIEDFELEFDNEFLDELLNINEELQPQDSPCKENPMVQWSPSEVLDFIRTETSVWSYFQTDISRFQCISGYIFKNLGVENCQILAQSKEMGTLIYEAKEQYLRSNIFQELDSPYPPNQNTQKNEICDILNEKCTTKKGRPKVTYTKRRKEKSEKLWEFLLHLLRDKKTELIRWENYEEGTFKFVRSDTVARLWGSRNQNQTMNYEKFTRAMRYHYKNKVLLPVPGKRLVYKFGPHAKGWQSTLPYH